ncbi:hypothetical protein MB02_07710 [Croceicoccus estronivorus]|uniref:nuclear transport factor 2 family protein n=1 Tax=Croceicoccus estronivorus TaxID=1172626 RepID=UPI0008336F01|nr:nuclear transport factor 2 family protein [Croceicoccus estronivorus]OCC24148.1 hypothetical protein MB02_07710 [Croceicoccus estronivorus]
MNGKTPEDASTGHFSELSSDAMFSIQDLAARAEIADLVARYSRAVDRRDFQLLLSLYAPGAIHNHGEAFSGEATGFVEWLRQSMGTMITQHLVGNMIVRVFGEEAEGEVYTVNHHMIEAGDTIQFTAGGRYLDHYIKTEGRWLFAHRRRVVDWSREELASPSSHTAGVLRGTVSSDDPSYDTLGRMTKMLG